MGYSAKIKIDTYDPRKDGTCAIYLQVIINRKKKRLDLGITWPAAKFNPVDGCKPRMRNDPDVDEYNVVIGNARTKANNIHKSYLLRSIHLTLDAFIKEYRSNLNKNDFIEYFGQKSYDRWNRNIISNETYQKEKGTLKRLKSFAAILPFHEFTAEFGPDFDRHLKKTFKNEINGRWNRHKHIITYLNMARDIDKIPFEDPYAKFSNKLVEGSWKPLNLAEMKNILEMYLDFKDSPLPLLPRKNGQRQVDLREGFTNAEVIVARKFLFGCNTALRISDLQELDEHKFNDGQMSLVPEKTERYGTKITSVPLNDIARMLLDHEIEDVRKERARTGKLLRIFERYSDQATNRLLKRIGAKCKLTCKLHNHTGLMTMMGLRKRATLEKYVKTNRKVIAADVEKMNAMLDIKNPAQGVT